MTLKVKLILALLLAALVPTALGIALSFGKSKEILTKTTLAALNVMADFKESEILLYLEHLKTRALDYSSDGLIRETLEKIMRNPTNKNLRILLTDHLVKNKLSLDSKISTIDVLDKNGQIVVSTESSRVGQRPAKNQKDQSIGTFKEGDELILHEADNLRIEIPLKTIYPPFLLIGSLMIRTSTNTLNQVLAGEHTQRQGAISVTKFSSFGTTGEIYLVGQNKRMFTDSRFVAGAKNKQVVDTLPVQKCLESKEEITGHWVNYLGQKVVGSSMCIDFQTYKWVLLVEESEAEAFSQITYLQIFLMCISVVTIFCLIPVVLFFAAPLFRRIRKLNEIAQKFGAGNLKARVNDKNSKDEIGTLSTGFNKMADQIEQREQELKSLKVAAEAASRAKTIFLSSMSHDIRSPLNAILGIGEILKDPGISQEKREALLKTLLRSGDGLLEMINNILEISKIENGKELKAEALSLREIAAELFSLYLPIAKEQGLEFSYKVEDGVPDYVLGDAVCIRRALENLIGNAIKFTEKGSVSVFIQNPDKNGQIVFSVKDTGIGISNDNLKNLFSEFFQVDSSYSKKFKGSGLGLAIAQRLVNLMGSKISVVSQEKAGSVFSFSLPLKEVSVLLPQKPPKASQPSSQTESKDPPPRALPLKILLVDDNEDNRMVVETFLKSTPHNVESVAGGNEALLKIKTPTQEKTTHYDVILMDLQMPHLNGFETTILIRQWEKQEKLSPLYIIALSASSMPEDIQKALESGCDRHLSKPIKKSVLIETLKSVAIFLQKNKSALDENRVLS